MSRRPTRSPRDYLRLALRLDQHIARGRGRVLRAGRPQGRGRPGAAPIPGQAARRRRRAPCSSSRRRSPTRSAVPGWRPSSSPSRPRRRASPASRCRTSSTSGAASPSRRRAATDAEFDAAAARIDALLPGRRAARRSRWRPGTRRFEIARRAAPGGDRLARRRGSAAGPSALRPARRASRCGSPSSAASRGRATTGTTAAGGPASRSTPTCRCGRRSLVHTIAHETYPGHHLEHAWKEADLVDAHGRLEASILLINTPECLISEGLADLGRDVRRPGGRRGRTCSSSCSTGPGWRSPPTPLPRATPPNGSVALDAPRGARSRRSAGNAAILRHADGRSHDEVLDYLRTVGRFSEPTAREAPRVHRASAVADVRVRLRRGRGAAAPLARCRPARGAARPGSAGCSASR